MNFHKNLIYIIIILALSQGANSQSDNSQSSPFRYGIFAFYNLNHDIVNFQQLPGIPNCCPNFDNGLGSGFSIGILSDYALPYSLKAGLRAGLSSLNNKLTETEETWVRIGADLAKGKFEHTIDATILGLAIEPDLSYNPIFGLNFTAGMSFNFLMTKDFAQEERIIEPVDRGVFADTRTRVRNDTSGVIPNTNSIMTFLFAGASYELPLNREGSFLLAPGIYYYLGLTNVVKETKWKINTFKAGLSLIYAPKSKEKIPVEKHLKEEIIDTITVEAKEILENKIIRGIPESSSRIKKNEDTTFIIETVRRTDTSFIQPGLTAKLNYKEPEITMTINYSSISYPILPVVFFDKTSTEFESYYNILSNKSEFSIEALDKNPITYHKNILNIIGKRMETNPASTIQLKGYVDFERENSDCGIALKRAEGIKDYLTKIWSIDERRIEILNGNCFPENVPSDKSDSAFAENRRVEILSSNPEIMSSLTFKEPLDTSIVFSDEINFDLGESTQKGITSYQIEGIQDGKQRFIFNPNESTAISQKIDKEIIDEELSGKPLEVSLTVEDINHRTATEKKKINFNKIIKTDDRHIVFSILFGLADDRLSNKVKNEMKFFVEKLGPAKVNVTGYSDIIGGEKKNRVLSANRAKNSTDLIRSINPKLDIISIKSFSYDKFPPGISSYGLPPERYLARTVLVEIIK